MLSRLIDRFQVYVSRPANLAFVVLGVLSLVYLAPYVWIAMLRPFSNVIGAERTPHVLHAASTIEDLAENEAMEQLSLLDLAVGDAGLIEYEIPGMFSPLERPTVTRMEEDATRRGLKRLRGYCVGQTMYAASVAEELGLTWRPRTSLREGHAWLEVLHDGQWYAINSLPEYKHPRPPQTRLIHENGYDLRLQRLGYFGGIRRNHATRLELFLMFSGPAWTLATAAILVLVARDICDRRQKRLRPAPV